MRISDWSSDVCSSDLTDGPNGLKRPAWASNADNWWHPSPEDRKSVVQGKSGSVRVDLGGRRIIKKKRIRRGDLISTTAIQDAEEDHNDIKKENSVTTAVEHVRRSDRKKKIQQK